MASQYQKKDKRIRKSETLEALLPLLSVEQLRFIVARQDTRTDKEAAEEIGVSSSTMYQWPPYVKAASELMAEDGLQVARQIRRKSVARAMAVKRALLDSQNERVRDKAATDIIEWEMGKAQESLDLTTKGERLLTDARTELQRRIDRLADTGAPDRDSEGSAATAGDGAAV